MRLSVSARTVGPRPSQEAKERKRVTTGMTVEKREQVFVSSTFKDLVDERAAVIQ
jgi:hypothetical protein